MTSLDIALPASRSASRYYANVVHVWRHSEWIGFAATPFQHPEWLDAFYAAAAADTSVEPLLVTVCNELGEVALRLPLIKRRKGNLSVIEFADLGMTDYNAPLLGSAAPQSMAEARKIWRVLRRALPKADLISLQKMPRQLNGQSNPLAMLLAATPSGANGNPLSIGDDWEAFRFSRERTYRKELERSWRVFQRNPQAQFRAISDPVEALRVLQVMEAQQRERMQDVGATYQLDQPVNTEFYRRLVQDNVANGYAVLTALTVGDEVVAALLGVRERNTYVMIRICHAGAAWSNCSPGRLIIERTMAHLHTAGCRIFDFSVGNYAYKRRFGVTRLPLVDATRALSWRGLVPLLRTRLAALTRQYPHLHARIRKALGKPASREEV